MWLSKPGLLRPSFHVAAHTSSRLLLFSEATYQVMSTAVLSRSSPGSHRLRQQFIRAQTSTEYLYCVNIAHSLLRIHCSGRLKMLWASECILWQEW